MHTTKRLLTAHSCLMRVLAQVRLDVPLHTLTAHHMEMSLVAIAHQVALGMVCHVMVAQSMPTAMAHMWSAKTGMCLAGNINNVIIYII